VTPSGSDPDGDALTWSGANLPSGATVNAATGVLTWTPSLTQAGTYPNVTLAASDGTLTGSASFTIIVTNVAQDVVSATPAPGTVLSAAVHCVTVPVTIARESSTPMRGFSTTITLSSELALCAGTASIVEGSYLNAIG